MFVNPSSILAQPAVLPDQAAPTLPAYQTVADALAAWQGDDPLYVLYPKRIAAAAEMFLNGFPGRVLYALKANPHPAVLQTLWAAGIRDVDVASIREVEQVQAALPSARLYMMNPVKSRRTISFSYDAGIRDFAFDCGDELTKIIEETGHAEDLTLHLRLTLPKTDAAMPLEHKFGAGFDEAVQLLQQARPVATKLGVTFHVGSQCMNPDSYDIAIAYVRRLVDAAGMALDSLDVGGGFPVAYPGMVPPVMDAFFARIRESLKRHGFDELQILGEPGRALCAEGGSTLARVELRKGQDLYLNDGSYGSLFDAAQCAWQYPVKLHAASERPQADEADFRFYGPTCDSIDVMNGPFMLPANVQEGDWIEIENLGAYGQALATRFNGCYSETTVAVVGE